MNTKFSIAILSLLILGCKTTKHKTNIDKNKIDKTSSGMNLKNVQDSTKIIQDLPKTIETSVIKDTRYYYERAYEQLKDMLENPEKLSFKKAVFISENAYYNESLFYDLYEKQISIYSVMAELLFKNLKLTGYAYSDSIRVRKNWGIFKVMTDTFQIGNDIPLHYGFSYNFEDYAGKKDWSSHFINTLFETGKGNCHSLPYLYKILADELQTEAYLALAPNHIYIKHRNQFFSWYNTELTSGQFPSDAWVKASGYITIDAIRSGIYMDTLSYKHSIALCVNDLAKSYISKTKKNGDDFVIKCCDLVLKHYENCINALLLKAETIKAKYDWARKQSDTVRAQSLLKEMEPIYYKCLKLGYREMPEEVYQTWLKSIDEQKEKFENQKINHIFEKP